MQGVLCDNFVPSEGFGSSKKFWELSHFVLQAQQGSHNSQEHVSNQEPSTGPPIEIELNYLHDQ